MSNGLLEGPLTSPTSRSSFDRIAIKLRALPIYQERNTTGHSMYNSALVKFAEYLSDGFESDIDADIDAILAAANVTETEKSSLIKSRIGQGAFGQKLVSYWNGCAVTGFKDTNLFVASHIKPWCASNNAERLDLFNGLLLAPKLDKAFDAGLITFDAEGHIKVSPLFSEPEKLGITLEMGVELTPQHEKFMDFHRTFVYRAT